MVYIIHNVHMRVLVVDDEPEIRAIVRKILERGTRLRRLRAEGGEWS